MSEPIAMIGMGCRFPGSVDSPEVFWQLLVEGVDAVCEVPLDRFNVNDLYDPDPAAPGKMSTRWGGFLDQVDAFDADFFGISPREAIRVDPQHRLLLEVSWEALEHAGLAPSRLAGSKTGVFVGVIGNDYALLQSHDLSDMDMFSGAGCSHAVLANRISYVLDLVGPSMTIDTACSSSLVAVHLACQSLRRHESDLALAGGVNLILGPEMTIALSKAHMMAADGRCKTFDEKADGYVRGEGCGVVVLKRLADALADGDRVEAIIRGSAVNHDGRSNGLSAPNGPAQEAVMRAALDGSGLAASDIDYVEAHGTGTRLGDPIEIEALRAVYGASRTIHKPLVVASLKTNIGHLESAAGVASLIKVALMVQRGEIPPHLHLNKINPLLDIAGFPLLIPRERQLWSSSGPRRRAGVSSFGFGGANAHLVVEQAAEAETHETSGQSWQISTLSARSRAALVALAQRYATEIDPAIPITDLALTANTGRSHFAHRAAVITQSTAELQETLREITAAQCPAKLVVHDRPANHPPRIAMLFTGQGAQYPAMGRQLYTTEAVFRDTMNRCANELDACLDRPFLSLLEADAGALVDQTAYTQPLIFALQVSLAALWRSWGVVPLAVMGHSVGEYAAAHVAGAISLVDGLQLIAERGRLMQALPAGGSMAAILASPGVVEHAIKAYVDTVSIAAYNGPENTVISGSVESIDQVVKELRKTGVRSRFLATSHAFHSYLLDPMLDELHETAGSLSWQPPKIPIVCNLSGKAAEDNTLADPLYWRNHSRQPVRFVDGIRSLGELGCDTFIEIGPSPTLITMGQRVNADTGCLWLPSLRKDHDDRRTLLTSLAQLYVRGAQINWLGLSANQQAAKAVLPTYPFQRTRYFSASAARVWRGSDIEEKDASTREHPLLGRRLPLATTEIVFESRIAAQRPKILADHIVQDTVLLPGAAYLEIALAASVEVFGERREVTGTRFLEPLIIDDQPITIQTVIETSSATSITFRIASVKRGEPGAAPVFTDHATGHLRPGSNAEIVDLDALRAQFAVEARDEIWRDENLRRSGLTPGPSFSWGVAFWIMENAALAQVRQPHDADRCADYHFHPGLLDSCFQLLGSILLGDKTDIDAHVPVAVESLIVGGDLSSAAWMSATLNSYNGSLAVGSVFVLDSAGKVLAVVDQIQLRLVQRDWLARLLHPVKSDWLYELAWVKDQHAVAESLQPESGDRAWLFCDSHDGLGSDIAAILTAQGHYCRVVDSSTDAESRRSMVEDFFAEAPGTWRGVIYMSGIASPADDQSTAPDFASARDSGWGGLLDVVHCFATVAREKPLRLWVLTRGGIAVSGKHTVDGLSQSMLWGLARVVAAERPDTGCTLIDIDPDERLPTPGELLDELLTVPPHEQIVLRGGKRLAARLRRLPALSRSRLELPPGRPYRLEVTTRGQLDGVVLNPVERIRPGPGQLAIEVRATGLNFRDVLNVLDLYPGDPGPLGGECAGIVTEVGFGVANLTPGDEVFALAPASFSSNVLTRADFVARKPEYISFEEASTLPVCFLTADLALRRFGQLQKGQRILIHGASGGVGSAAIQIAQRLGAEIFATAGSPQKRSYLESIGVHHVMDSRSTEFSQQIMEFTDGEGVDLVINSLIGEAMAASLSVVCEGGCFVELGKIDVYDQKQVDQLRPGLRFFAIALDRMMAEEAQTVAELIRELGIAIESRRIVPLPLKSFVIHDAVDALRLMARAEHIGKVVITAASTGMSDGQFELRSEASYLITGGLGGLGLEVAQWAATRGAGSLILAGRSAPGDAAHEVLSKLRNRGIHVETAAVDVSSGEKVADLVSRIRGQRLPLAGVFHLAAEIDDAPLEKLNRKRFDTVLAAKAIGAWNLHTHTEELPLDHFVLFSSAAGVMGSPGQANYAAANVFLDALAHYRRSFGLPATSIDWGAFSGAGMAARLEDSQGDRWAAAGIGWIEPSTGLRVLERLLDEDRSQVVVLAMDWPKFFSRFPQGTVPPWLSRIAESTTLAGSSGVEVAPVLRDALVVAAPAERYELALEFFQVQAAIVLAREDGDLPDPDRLLNELGFDSLTAVECCNRLGGAIGHRINPILLFDYPTLSSLTQYLLTDVLNLDLGDTPQPLPEAPSSEVVETQDLAEEVENLSEDDINELVTKHIEKLDS